LKKLNTPIVLSIVAIIIAVGALSLSLVRPYKAKQNKAKQNYEEISYFRLNGNQIKKIKPGVGPIPTIDWQPIIETMHSQGVPLDTVLWSLTNNEDLIRYVKQVYEAAEVK
jgi:hypothetical protein